MNPIWRMAHEMSKSRTETQKRNQRRREAVKAKKTQVKEQQRQEYLDRDRRRYMVGQENEGGIDTVEHQTEEESVAEKFQKELCWCIEQLENGLLNPKATKIQKQETEKILKTLKSSRAPMAKKRQVMHATFGDYRTKMQNEKKKHAEEMKKCFIAPAEDTKVVKGRFLRRSSSTSKTDTASIAVPNNVLMVVQDANTEEEEKGDHGNSCHGNNQVEDNTNRGEVSQSESKEKGGNKNIDSSENCLATKSNGFRFDFEVEDEESKSEDEGEKTSSQEEKHELEKAMEGSSKVKAEIHREKESTDDDDDEVTKDAQIESNSQDNMTLQQGIDNMKIESQNN